MIWTIVSTAVALLGVIWGVYRWFDSKRKARTDRALGEALVKVDALKKTVEAGKERVKTDAEVVKLPDADADGRLSKWMRD